MGKVDKDLQARIVELYKSGESPGRIARQVHVSTPTIYKWLHRLGVILRDLPGSNIRHDAFDEVTPDAAYWISVRLSERDRKHLVKLRSFLNSNHAISVAPAGNYGGYRSKPSVHLTLVSECLARQLLSLGRYESPISDPLIQSRDFWRGVVDGDGSLGVVATGYAYLFS